PYERSDLLPQLSKGGRTQRYLIVSRREVTPRHRRQQRAAEALRGDGADALAINDGFRRHSRGDVCNALGSFESGQHVDVLGGVASLVNGEPLVEGLSVQGGGAGQVGEAGSEDCRRTE